MLPGDGDCWAHWRSSLRGQGGFTNMQIHLNYQNGIFKIRKGSVNTNKMGPGSPVAGPRFVTARISRVGKCILFKTAATGGPALHDRLTWWSVHTQFNIVCKHESFHDYQ